MAQQLKIRFHDVNNISNFVNVTSKFNTGV